MPTIKFRLPKVDALKLDEIDPGVQAFVHMLKEGRGVYEVLDDALVYFAQVNANNMKIIEGYVNKSLPAPILIQVANEKELEKIRKQIQG